MAGSKKSKLKKALLPSTYSEPPMDNADDDLVDDLLAQLDSRDQTVQAESANVLNEMNLRQQANSLESSGKLNAKDRFQARQVMQSIL